MHRDTKFGAQKRHQRTNPGATCWRLLPRNPKLFAHPGVLPDRIAGSLNRAPVAEGLPHMSTRTVLRRWVYALICAASMPAVAEQAPADAGCGYVSTSAKPPLSEDTYPADITRIDGEDTPTRALNRYRLSVGRHAIAVQEQIGSTPRGYTKLRKLGNKEVALVYKIIKVDIKANTSYQIGAQLHPDKLDPKQPNAYWTPVVWRTSAEECH